MTPWRLAKIGVPAALAAALLAGCGVSGAGTPNATASKSTTTKSTAAKSSTSTKTTQASAKVPVPWATVGKKTVDKTTVLKRTQMLALIDASVPLSAAVSATTLNDAVQQLVSESLVQQGNPVPKPPASTVNSDLLTFEQELTQEYGTTTALSAREKALSVTSADLKAFVNQEVWVEQSAAAYQPPVSVAQVQAYYNAHKSAFALSAAEVNARHILVKTQALAEKILSQVKADKGKNFAALAKQYSIDTGSAAQGGNLGWFTAATMVAPFSKAAFSTPVGGFTIAHSQYGWHVIQVLGKEAKGSIPPLSQVQTQAQQDAQTAANNQNIAAALARLRKQFKVTVHS